MHKSYKANNINITQVLIQLAHLPEDGMSHIPKSSPTLIKPEHNSAKFQLKIQFNLRTIYFISFLPSLRGGASQMDHL